MFLAALAAVSVAAFAVPARADDTSNQNFLIGPLIGVRLGGPPGDRGVFGVESTGEARGIIGLWEGLPIAGEALHHCPQGYSSLVTLSAGLRYSGVLELYATLKAGVSQSICF